MVPENVNDDYWGEPVALEKATFRFISDPAAALSAMLAGDVDAFANFPAPETIPQLRADPRFSVVIGSTEGETILSTNNTKAPCLDLTPDHRQARPLPSQHNPGNEIPEEHWMYRFAKKHWFFGFSSE